MIIFLKNYKYLASSLLTWQEVAYEAYREFTELVSTQRQCGSLRFYTRLLFFSLINTFFMSFLYQSHLIAYLYFPLHKLINILA